MPEQVVIVIDVDGTISTMKIDSDTYFDEHRPTCSSSGIRFSDLNWSYSMSEFESDTLNPVATELGRLVFGSRVFGRVILRKVVDFEDVDADIQDIHDLLHAIRQHDDPTWRVLTLGVICALAFGGILGSVLSRFSS